MIKREEVEEMLIGCGEPPLNTKDDLCLVPATTLAELARTWLRVNDAPVVLANEWIWENVPEELELKRIRLVPEADSGGEG